MSSTPTVLFSFLALACVVVTLNTRQSRHAIVTTSLEDLASFLAPQSTSTSSYSLAEKESFGFFDYITDEDWKFRQKLARTRQDHPKNGPSASGGSTASKLFYLNHYYPSFTCPHTVRVGREPGDGPKFICDPHRLVQVVKKRNETCLVYSVGSKGRFEFENGLVEFTGNDCEIHVIDPGNYARSTPKNMHYHQWGIISSYDKSYNPVIRHGEFRTMQETVKALGHSDRVIDVLKIDCEDCEWYTYKDWLEFDIRQILVETHNTPNQTCDFFDGLINAGYVMYSKEPNIHPHALRGNAMGVEWSFIKLDPAFSKPLGIPDIGDKVAKPS